MRCCSDLSLFDKVRLGLRESNTVGWDNAHLSIELAIRVYDNPVGKRFLSEFLHQITSIMLDQVSCDWRWEALDSDDNDAWVLNRSHTLRYWLVNACESRYVRVYDCSLVHAYSCSNINPSQSFSRLIGLLMSCFIRVNPSQVCEDFSPIYIR